jgi:hypothetical protein
VLFAGVGAWRHRNQTEGTHQPLHTLAVHAMALGAEPDHHFPAAVKRVPGVFLVQQTQQEKLSFIRNRHPVRVNGGPCNTRQLALRHHGQPTVGTDPALPLA